MSERFFDDLARTLARPMPRRRAVRLLGATLVTAAMPGLRPQRAAAQGCDGRCTGAGQSLCGEPKGVGCLHTCCNDLRPVCCKWPETETYICCGKNEKCGDKPGTCVPACPGPRVCGTKCCPSGQKCTWSNRKRTCCPTSRIVSKGGNRFCCPKGTLAIRGDRCCPPNDRDCCGGVGADEDLAPLGKREFCVRGKVVKL